MSSSAILTEFSRRAIIKGPLTVAAVGILETGRGLGESSADVTPEMFGAKGDGISNDSAAFARLAAHVTALGGGIVKLRHTTYLVGAQSRTTGDGPWAFAPQPLLVFERCRKPLIIQGNGARLLCAGGLRFGTFDRVSGEATRHPMRTRVRGELASPYRFMILVSRCTGSVEIADLDLDGNVAGLEIGGPYGDKGYQIFASGLSLQENTGTETVRNVHSHHHAQDGFYIVGAEQRCQDIRSRFDKVRAEYNARQGCSLLAGKAYVFSDCIFSHTGKADLMSPPGAGVDIEARPKRTVRDVRFDRCVFENNSGVGMVADRGNSADVSFNRCRFVATSNWAIWPQKPNFVFNDCRFVGAIVRCFTSPDPMVATRFERCIFSDDPKLSPTGKVFLHGSTGPIADLARGLNVRFNRCSFLLGHAAVLPWSVSAIYADCTMRQSVSRRAFPRGRYVGRNTINGNVDIAHSTVSGVLTINGRVVPPRSASPRKESATPAAERTTASAPLRTR